MARSRSSGKRGVDAMKKYHKYVFDMKKRSFVGDFELMYKNETIENFDSWHQEDTRQLQRHIDMYIMGEYNFNSILDIGCGKGHFTHQLKKKNNIVHGLDISKTAVKVAKEKFPDVIFSHLDVNNISKLNKFFEKNAKYDLAFTSEVFSYLKNWKNVLNVISRHVDFFLISLYIPNNPIGFVKSEQNLIEEIVKYFIIIEHISIKTKDFVIIFAKSNNIND